MYSGREIANLRSKAYKAHDWDSWMYWMGYGDWLNRAMDAGSRIHEPYYQMGYEDAQGEDYGNHLLIGKP